jgi:primosomal replication protein N
LALIKKKGKTKMQITYSIWQGSIIKGSGFTASKMSEVEDTIKELNSTNIQPKFEYFISRVGN